MGWFDKADIDVTQVPVFHAACKKHCKNPATYVTPATPTTETTTTPVGDGKTEPSTQEPAKETLFTTKNMLIAGGVILAVLVLVVVICLFTGKSNAPPPVHDVEAPI